MSDARTELVRCPACGKVRPVVTAVVSAARREYLETRPCRKCWKKMALAGLRSDLVTGFTDFNGTRPVPAAATAAAPGTEEKLRVMEARFAAGEHLHHPADPKLVHGPCRSRFLAGLLERLALRTG